MSVQRATDLINKQISGSEAEGALDPATLTLIFTILGQFLEVCRKKGETATSQVDMLRTPAKHLIVKFRNALRKQLGSATYKSLGGPRFVDELTSASMSLKVGEARALIKDLSTSG